jgi:hypothetical protein
MKRGIAVLASLSALVTVGYLTASKLLADEQAVWKLLGSKDE